MCSTYVAKKIGRLVLSAVYSYPQLFSLTAGPSSWKCASRKRPSSETNLSMRVGLRRQASQLEGHGDGELAFE